MKNNRLKHGKYVKKPLLIKQCPITKGMPTRMTKQSYQKQCKHYQLMKRRSIMLLNDFQTSTTICEKCKGENIPKELQIACAGCFKTISTKGKDVYLCSDCETKLKKKSNKWNNK